jgi:molybdopterin adenylyltransferase
MNVPNLSSAFSSGERSEKRTQASRLRMGILRFDFDHEWTVKMTERAFMSIDCMVVTVSDTRTIDTDRSGAIIVERLESMGHHVVDRRIVPDEVHEIQSAVRAAMASPEVVAVILTGGSGITRRDVTPDAVAELGSKHIPGFGELFRWLSYADIGPSTIQSRADAWLCDETLAFVLPGSAGAVTLAMDKILIDQLDVRTRPCNFVQLLDRIRS